MNRQSIITFVAMLMLAVVASLFITMQWAYLVLVGRAFSGFPDWWSMPNFLMALDEFGVLLVAGLGLGYLTSLRRPWLLGLVLGIAFGLIRHGLGHIWLSREAGVLDLFWAYSEYYLSPLGAVVGVLIGARLQRTRRIRVAV